MHRLPLLCLDGCARRAELLPPAAHVERNLVERVLAARRVARLEFIPLLRELHRVHDVSAEPLVAG